MVRIIKYVKKKRKEKRSQKHRTKKEYMILYMPNNKFTIHVNVVLYINACPGLLRPGNVVILVVVSKIIILYLLDYGNKEVFKTLNKKKVTPTWHTCSIPAYSFFLLIVLHLTAYYD